MSQVARNLTDCFDGFLFGQRYLAARISLFRAGFLAGSKHDSPGPSQLMQAFRMALRCCDSTFETILVHWTNY